MRIKNVVAALLSLTLLLSVYSHQLYAQGGGDDIYLPYIAGGGGGSQAPTAMPVNTATPAATATSTPAATFTPTQVPNVTSTPTSTPTSSIPVQGLFREATEWQTDMPADQQNVLGDFVAINAPERYIVVQADKAQFDTAATLDFNLFDDTLFAMQRESLETDPNGQKIWSGLGDGGETNAIFILEGDGIYGTIHTEERIYQIDTIGSYQLITEIDASKLPIEEPPGFGDSTVGIEQKLQASAVDSIQVEGAVTSKISLLVAYTETAQKNQIDIEKWIAQRVAETNRSFRNSNIDAEIVLEDTYLISYTESKEGSQKLYTDLNRFVNDGDGYMDDVHKKRLAVGADIAVLLVSNTLYEYCGIAGDILATADTSFAITRLKCLGYTFTHEIGHLLGARHNPEADPSTRPYEYGHGYQHTTSDNKWRTIMAYPTGCDYCPRLLYWSSPNVSFAGHPMGTAEKHDNARVINLNHAKVANFYQKPISIKAVTINGPDSGATATEYAFSAVLDAPNATPPFTYRWAPEPVRGQGTNTAVYRWTSAEIKKIALFVENPAGTVQTEHFIDISTPVQKVSITGPAKGIDTENIVFNAAVVPTNATAPVNYLWEPAPIIGQGTAKATYRWTSAGKKTIKVTASNAQGSATAIHQIAIATDANFVSVWQDDKDQNNVYDILARGFESSGTQAFGDMTVNSNSNGQQRHPQVAFGADGSQVVVWEDDQDGNGSYQIRARGLNANGTEKFGDITINSVASGQQRRPSIGIAADGSFVVAWEDDQDRNGFYNILARGFNANGTQKFKDTLVHSIGRGQQYKPQIAVAPGGSFVVVWEDDQDENGFFEIMARGFNANGTQRFSDIVINSVSSGQQLKPQIAMASDGSFVVVWEDDQNENGFFEILARGFNTNGTQKFSALGVNSVGKGQQRNPQIDVASNGSFVVVWEDDQDENSFYEILARGFNANGTQKFKDFIVNSAGRGQQLKPQIGMAPNGTFVVAWEDDSNENRFYQIVARGFNANGTQKFKDFVVNSVGTGQQRNPSIAMR